MISNSFCTVSGTPFCVAPEMRSGVDPQAFFSCLAFSLISSFVSASILFFDVSAANEITSLLSVLLVVSKVYLSESPLVFSKSNLYKLYLSESPLVFSKSNLSKLYLSESGGAA